MKFWNKYYWFGENIQLSIWEQNCSLCAVSYPHAWASVGMVGEEMESVGSSSKLGK